MEVQSKLKQSVGQSVGKTVVRTIGQSVGMSHEKSLMRLKRVRGQIDGIENMIEERRYCHEILMQIRAARAALKAIEAQVLERHVRGCVQQSLESKNKKDIEKKVEELMDLFKSY